MDASSARNLSEYGWRPANSDDRRRELERALEHWFESLKQASDSSRSSSSAAARVVFWKALVDSWRKHAVAANDYTFANTSLPASLGDTGDEWNSTIRLYRKEAWRLHAARESGPLVTLVRYSRTREFPWVTWQLWVRVIDPPTQAHRAMPTKLTGPVLSSTNWSHENAPLNELTQPLIQVEPPAVVPPVPVPNAESASGWRKELSLAPIEERPRDSPSHTFEELTLVPIEPQSELTPASQVECDPESRPDTEQSSQVGRDPPEEKNGQADGRPRSASVRLGLSLWFKRLEAHHPASGLHQRRTPFMYGGMGMGWFGSLFPHLAVWFFVLYGINWIEQTFVRSTLLIRWVSALFDALLFPLVTM